MSSNVRVIKKILSVTDQNELKKTLRDIFEQPESSFYLSEVSTEKEAVAQAVRENPDFVLMDASLHSLDSFEAAKKIKKALPKCKVILLMTCDCPKGL